MVEPWMSKLAERDSRAAWDLFAARYRRLILATIRHLTRSPDDVLDVFAHVCEALGADDLARLRRYSDDPRSPGRASFSTWLVVVVRHQTIDWLRHRDGRRRPGAPPALTSLQQRIFEHEILEGRPRLEAYELICSGAGPDMPFGVFLKEVRATYRALDAAHWRAEAGDPDDASPLTDDVAEAGGEDPLAAAHAGEQVGDALGALAPDERLAVQLFVVDGLSAAEVARAVGWRNAKAVYNGVYRALAAARAGLEQRGLRRDDF